MSDSIIHRVSTPSGGHTLSPLKVKQPHYREGERGWEAKI
jgi:hypothetical protein